MHIILSVYPIERTLISSPSANRCDTGCQDWGEVSWAAVLTVGPGIGWLTAYADNSTCSIFMGSKIRIMVPLSSLACMRIGDGSPRWCALSMDRNAALVTMRFDPLIRGTLCFPFLIEAASFGCFVVS